MKRGYNFAIRKSIRFRFDFCSFSTKVTFGMFGVFVTLRKKGVFDQLYFSLDNPFA